MDSIGSWEYPDFCPSPCNDQALKVHLRWLFQRVQLKFFCKSLSISSLSSSDMKIFRKLWGKNHNIFIIHLMFLILSSRPRKLFQCFLLECMLRGKERIYFHHNKYEGETREYWHWVTSFTWRLKTYTKQIMVYFTYISPSSPKWLSSEFMFIIPSLSPLQLSSLNKYRGWVTIKNNETPLGQYPCMK